MTKEEETEIKIKTPEGGETESFYIRTIYRKDVYFRLRDFAKAYATGRGHWDLGVAIQILLDHYEESKMALQSDKLDAILAGLQDLAERNKEESKPVEEKKYIELVGGKREEIK